MAKGGGYICIPQENHAILLQSGELNLGGNQVKTGKIVKTVLRIFEGWTKREVKEAKLARTVQSRVGNMCDAKLKQMASMNGLKNAPICPEHVTNATCIFGPDTAVLEGKTVRRPPPRVFDEGGGG